MGYASARIYRLGGFEAHPLAFGLYGSQLALNFMWSPVRCGRACTHAHLTAAAGRLGSP